MSELEEFQGYLKTALRLRGWSVLRLADETAISPDLIYRWLRSEKPIRPSPANLKKLAPVLSVAEENLFRMVGHLPPGTEQRADPDEVEMLALFRQVPLEQRGAAKQYVRFLAVQPTQRRSSGRSDAVSKRLKRLQAEREAQSPANGTDISDATLGHELGSVFRTLAHFTSALASTNQRTSLRAATV